MNNVLKRRGCLGGWIEVIAFLVSTAPSSAPAVLFGEAAKKSIITNK